MPRTSGRSSTNGFTSSTATVVSIASPLTGVPFVARGESSSGTSTSAADPSLAAARFADAPTKVLADDVETSSPLGDDRHAPIATGVGTITRFEKKLLTRAQLASSTTRRVPQLSRAHVKYPDR